MSDPNAADTAPLEWPHAPVHRLTSGGAYMVTAATYQKQLHFTTPERLELVLRHLFTVTAEFGWQLQAWAVLANHYHFVAITPKDATTLPKMIGKMHTLIAREINRQDASPGRKVWHQYWDSSISYDGSYLARLKYVHQNPVHHGVAAVAENYHWCSAGWFLRTADRPFYQTVSRIAIDRVNVIDDF